MSSGRFSQAFRLRVAMLAVGAIAACAVSAAPAFASHYKQSPAGSSPLTIWIGNDGWFQELVAGNTDNSFFPRSQPQTGDVSANAGFVLAFPNSQAGSSNDNIEGEVWGWAHDEVASQLEFDGNFVPVSQGNWTGAGTELSPYTQVTEYEVVDGAPLVEVVQTARYVNGDSNFVTSYAVRNLTADPLRFRALIGADVFLNGSDCGSGIFKSGPPRFVGGFGQGRVGGFTEETSSPWTTYFEGNYGGPPADCETNPTGALGVWDYLEGAENAAGPTAGFPTPGSINPNVVDNGIGIQWDDKFTTPLAAGDTYTFQLNTLGTVPGELSLAPSSQTLTVGAMALLTATAIESTGAPASGAVVRFTVSGANAASGVVTTNTAGQAVLSYTPTSGGTDTVSAFEDIDGDGVRGQGEPAASATVSVTAPPGSSDKTPPKLTLYVSSKVKRKKFLKGLTAAAKVNEAASLKFELLGTPPARKRKTRAKSFTRKLARQLLPTAGAGLRATRLRPSKKKVGKAKKFVVQLKVTATDRAGNTAVATKKIKVR